MGSDSDSDDDNLTGWKKFKKKATPSPAVFAKISFLCLLFFGFLIMVLLRDDFFGILEAVQFDVPSWMNWLLDLNMTTYNPYLDEVAPYWYDTFGVTLTGFTSVHRIAASLGIFFLTHLVFSLPSCIPGPLGKRSAVCVIFLNSNCCLMTIKYIVWVIVALTTFFIHDTVFVVVAWISIFLSGLFLLIQVVILMEMSWGWQDFFVKNLDAKEREKNDMGEGEGWTCAQLLYVICTLAIYIIAIGFLIFMFVIFSWGGCWYLILIMVAYTIAALSLVGVSFCPFLRMGLLPPAIIALYGVYMTYSSLLSFPLPECNIFSAFSNTTLVDGDDWVSVNLNNFGQIFSIVLTVLFALVSTTYSALSSSGSVKKAFSVKCDCGDEDGVDNDDEEPNKIHDAAVGMAWSHVIYYLASHFFGTILTNWEIGEPSTELQLGGTITYDINVSYTAFGVKLSMVVIAFCLFIWIALKKRFIDDADDEDDD